MKEPTMDCVLDNDAEIDPGQITTISAANADAEDSPNTELGQTPPLTGVQIATLVGIKDNATPLIKCQATGVPPRLGRSIVPLTEELIGAEVLVAAAGPSEQLVLIGVLQQPSPQGQSMTRVQSDGNSMVLMAEQEIRLQCGEAQIELRKDGKITLRGTYILSRSTGANSMKGGSIQLN